MQSNRTNTKHFDPTKYSLNNPYIYTIAEQHAILTRYKLGNPVYAWDGQTWLTLSPEAMEICVFNFQDNIYSTTIPTQAPVNIQNIPARPNQFDIPVFPPNHVCHKRIVYDPDACEYYDKTTDIFLTEDDIKFYGLRAYKDITTPLPSPLPENYWDAVSE